jgi:hypothetical protein
MSPVQEGRKKLRCGSKSIAPQEKRTRLVYREWAIQQITEEFERSREDGRVVVWVGEERRMDALMFGSPHQFYVSSQSKRGGTTRAETTVRAKPPSKEQGRFLSAMPPIDRIKTIFVGQYDLAHTASLRRKERSILTS